MMLGVGDGGRVFRDFSGGMNCGVEGLEARRARAALEPGLGGFFFFGLVRAGEGIGVGGGEGLRSVVVICLL